MGVESACNVCGVYAARACDVIYLFIFAIAQKTQPKRAANKANSDISCTDVICSTDSVSVTIQRDDARKSACIIGCY